jgi:hypothetical protein
MDLTDLNTSHTLGYTGRNNSNPSNGSSGHAGDSRSGQTRKSEGEVVKKSPVLCTYSVIVIVSVLSCVCNILRCHCTCQE